MWRGKEEITRSEDVLQVLGGRAGVATENGEQVSGYNLHCFFRMRGWEQIARDWYLLGFLKAGKDGTAYKQIYIGLLKNEFSWLNLVRSFFVLAVVSLVMLFLCLVEERGMYLSRLRLITMTSRGNWETALWVLWPLFVIFL